MNEVLETKTFFEEYLASEPDEKEWIDKVKEQLKENLAIGKVLKYYWFREKRYGGNRLYFVINEKTKKAMLISYGSKKDQQEMINAIISNMNYYLQFIRD